MSQKKYQIKNESPKLTDDQISRHKDFNGLLNDYRDVTQDRHKVPLYKNRKLFLLVLLIALVVWVIVSSEEEKAVELPATEVNSSE